MRIVGLVACGLPLYACGFPPGSASNLHPPVTRSGPVCDSLIARVTSGDPLVKVSNPVARSMVIPPDNPPGALKGKTLPVQFHVDAAGRSTVDTTALQVIESRRYRADLLDRLNQFTFAPAVAEGCAVPASLTITFTFQ